ncbi:MAG: endonuclease NucS [Candidatus Nanopelagicaceae bacterium]|nr:endonuclease NucS [Candidatus Nanopelagicaceae bacterium]
MRNFFQLRLGKGGAFVDECLDDGFVGVGWFADTDLSVVFASSTDMRQFNKQMIPIYLAEHPEAVKVTAGLACGSTFTVCKGMQVGDVVLCPKGGNNYAVGEISSEYEYRKGTNLPHRRKVNWQKTSLNRGDFTTELKNAMGFIGTVSKISHHAIELEALLTGQSAMTLLSTDPTVEDPSIFALEKHLEDFLVANWKGTELSKQYDIYEDAGEIVGQQYMTDTGPMDILAISKDRKELLVIELKKGRVSDVVVGQIQRYMGYAKEELCEEGQSVRGLIIGLEDDNKLRRALSATVNIDFYRYAVDFKLIKGFAD